MKQIQGHAAKILDVHHETMTFIAENEPLAAGTFNNAIQLFRVQFIFPAGIPPLKTPDADAGNSRISIWHNECYQYHQYQTLNTPPPPGLWQK